MRYQNRSQTWALVVAVLWLFPFSGCGSPTETGQVVPEERELTDIELGVSMPRDRDDPGTLPDDQSMNPPDILLDADNQLQMTLGAAQPAAEPGSVPVPIPDTTSSGGSGEGQAANLESGAGISKVAGDVEEILDGGGLVGPEDWRDWQQPQAVLVISGQQHGYIEPCGCTGLDNQKGGMMRRYSLLEEIRGRDWEVVPLDAGNQIRRSGRQAAIKFKTSVKGLEQMGYKSVGIGPDDLKVGASELLSIAADDGSGANPFTSANVEIVAPGLVATFKKLEVRGRIIGVTTALDPQTIEDRLEDAIQVGDVEARVAAVLEEMKAAGCEFNVLLFFGGTDAAKQVVRKVPGFDLVVAGATVGEPRYQPEEIEGTECRLVMTGDKGMYVGLIGLYADQPFKYARVGLTSKFEDARPILDLMASYQNQLKQLGLDGLGIETGAHPSGREFVGSEKCGECHTTAFAIWENTPHFEATADIVHPGERSEIPRHFDPECLACHVTGWNTKFYYPYTSGYLSLAATPLMVGNGCENCHGPGKSHVDAEEGTSGLSDDEVAAIRESVKLPLDRARDKCLECHDLDNSPDFHKDGAFDDYWAEVEHYGVD